MLEPVTRIEPCLPEVFEPKVANLVSKLTAASTLLGARLPGETAASLAELVRIMNCYYSNLIEGHNTRPRDIERALAAEFEPDRERRNLQLEAAAHIRLQREIDRRHLDGTLDEPTSAAFAKWLHAEFYRDAPAEMLLVKGNGRTIEMTPGEFRRRPEEEVSVGRHLPPSSDRVEAFMDHFAERYRFDRLGEAERIVAIAAAHHRFNYIHPFPDGNGRVSRLMSHAMALKAGIGAHGLWSISRGLARGIADRGEYKLMMDHADSPRGGDLDGRGNLSLRALNEFVTWFLSVSLDQVTFMAEMFDIDRLGARFVRLVDSWDLRPGTARILQRALALGQVTRGEAVQAGGASESTMRAQLRQLIGRGILASDSPKGPVSLRFSIDTADVLFPRLFGDQAA